MPINYKLYDKNWKVMSRSIIRDRAKNHCELCNAENGQLHWKTKSRVVLTVHHINRDIKDNHALNLIGLCQRCHLRLDIREKLRKRREQMKKKNKIKKKSKKTSVSSLIKKKIIYNPSDLVFNKEKSNG